MLAAKISKMLEIYGSYNNTFIMNHNLADSILDLMHEKAGLIHDTTTRQALLAAISNDEPCFFSNSRFSLQFEGHKLVVSVYIQCITDNRSYTTLIGKITLFQLLPFTATCYT